MNAAYLWGELEVASDINDNRLKIWENYYKAFKGLSREGRLSLPYIPDGCTHNAHMFYVKCADLKERTSLISYLKNRGIQASFHYVPLHSSPAGQRFGRFDGEDVFTTKESDRLARLPMYYGLDKSDQDAVISAVFEFHR